MGTRSQVTLLIIDGGVVLVVVAEIEGFRLFQDKVVRARAELEAKLISLILTQGSPTAHLQGFP